MRHFLIAPCILLAALLPAALANFRHESARQPIQFNHNLHTQELEMDCTECHRYVEEAEFAGRPKLEYCADCHEESLTENPEEGKLIEYVGTGREIPWQRLYHVPDHVYFSHRRHVTVTQIDCERCHGDIPLTSSPPEEPLVHLSMDFCMDCHEQEGVSLDCNTCHR